MQLNAMCFPKGGFSSAFAIPVTEKNTALLRDIAIRASQLNKSRRNLRVKTMLAEDYKVDRVAIVPQPSGVGELGFDFQSITFDCYETREPVVCFHDERRERGLEVRLTSSDISSLLQMEPPLPTCCRCQHPMSEKDAMKGERWCSYCIVETTP